MSYLALQGLRVRFSPTVEIGPVSLDIAQGEILALLGPSGSGKTTILRMLAGFEAPQGGRIVVEGEDVTALPPARRHFGMVFQHYALFPHLDVGENVAFGLTGDPNPGRKAGDALKLVDLAGFERRKVHELSGGQQQRVALARALAPAPRVLLLDEAFDLGDRVAVLQQGRLEQVGTPEDLYERPASLFVATFVGRANVLKDGAARTLGGAPGEVLVIRPEALRFGTAGVAGIVRERRYAGVAAFYVVEAESGERLEVMAEPGAATVGA